MSAAKNLSDVLRAVADRVERGATFPAALREAASELDEQGDNVPPWHLALIDEALADKEDIDEPWDAALAQIREEVSRP